MMMSFKHNIMYRFVLLKHNPQVREAPWTYDLVEPTKEVLDMVITINTTKAARPQLEWQSQ